MTHTTASDSHTAVMAKTPTGIKGLDEITGGGLPQGRPTLVCGGTGCGKTLLAMEFLVRGATQFGEPGVFMSFEEKSGELARNFASLGFDLNELVRQSRLAIDHVHLDAREIEETGEYDLEGLISASATPSTLWAPNGSSWIPLRRCSPGCPTKSSCVRNCAACSAS